jgi:hypothetical protein
MVHNYDQYNGKTTICRISLSVNSRDGIDFAMLFTLGKAGELQILSRRRRDQGIAVGNYSFTLDAEALRLFQRWTIIY